MSSNAQPNTPPRRRWFGRVLGIMMVVFGVLLLTIISGYYAYSVSARSQLDHLNFSVGQTAQPASAAVMGAHAASADTLSARNANLPQTAEVASAQPVESRSAAARAQSQSSSPVSQSPPAATPVASSPAGEPTPANDTRAAPPASSYTALYPATRIHPKFWGQPLWSGGEPYLYSTNLKPALPDGFRAISATDDALATGDGALTTRITIPSIEVDSTIAELAIVNIGDSRAYETPKNLVGHIPQSSNPGEIGNAWYFGHLESPIRGEGNVFRRLPDIPELLRNGDDVFAELEDANGRVFLYKVTRTEVVYQDDLTLYGSNSAQITLVACVPRLVYDHRILVTAELVGVNDTPNATH